MAKKTDKASFFDLNIFGLKLKPWHGIVAGIIIQMFFGGLLGGLGGILIIASVISLIHKLVTKRFRKR